MKRVSPLYYLGTSLLVLALDQISKTLVVKYLVLDHSIPVLGEFFKLTFIFNPGGAFGTRLGGFYFYTFLSLFAIVLAFWFFIKAPREQIPVRLGLAFIIGGAVGNLVDRLRFGEVVDFLDFDFFNIKILPFKFLFLNFSGLNLERWPVFNLADSFVTVGVVLLAFQILKSSKGAVEVNG